MKYLFNSWQEFSSEVTTASHTLLLLDYDGTLTPIVSRPEEALMSPQVGDKLSKLAEKTVYSVGIVSGRPMSELKDMVKLDGIYYAGNHGLEIEGPGLSFISQPAQAARSLMKKLAGEMSAALRDIEGVIIEDKGLSLSVHYRLVADGEENRVAEIFRRMTRPLLAEGRIKVTSGKKVYEVRPPIDWHKGKAAESIIKQIKSTLDISRLLSVYLGDDTTDEDAFKVIQRPEGWSIYVGGENPMSVAGYYLESVEEVEQLLSRLLQLN